MSAVAISSALGPGSRLGQYEIIAPLRAGGMATLFLGKRVGPAGFARHVAIKVVHSHLASDPSFIEMFLDEARLAARIQHPNVVHTEELGEERGMYYLAMEYVHGCTLSQFLPRLIQQKRALAPELAAHIVMKLADGLHAAHEVKDEDGRPLSVVHRDISPQNVLLSYEGQVKLIDFGVAKAAGRSRETSGASLKGKIRYMSPEQAWGRGVDRRTDVYALGIVLWESLTHRRLFTAEDDFAALERVRAPHVPPPSSLVPAIGDALDQVVLTALAADPEARFQTAQAFRRAIGGACSQALLVEPDDLAALLVSVMEDDIARERRSAPPAVTRALQVKQPEPARRTGAMAAYTREMPVYPGGADALAPDDSLGPPRDASLPGPSAHAVDPTPSIAVPANTSASSASAASRVSTPQALAASSLRWVVPAIGFTLLGIGSALVAWLVIEHSFGQPARAPEPPPIAASPASPLPTVPSGAAPTPVEPSVAPLAETPPIARPVELRSTTAARRPSHAELPPALPTATAPASASGPLAPAPGAPALAASAAPPVTPLPAPTTPATAPESPAIASPEPPSARPRLPAHVAHPTPSASPEVVSPAVRPYLTEPTF